METKAADLEAGKKLDRIVAEKVMGCYVREKWGGRYDLVVPGGADQIDFRTAEGAWYGAPDYSTDIAAAWLVAEKARLFTYHGCALTFEAGEWWMDDNHNHAVQASADTVPLAICRAALAAIRAS